MSSVHFNSAALVDNLIRTCFHVEPDVMAQLSVEDERVRLRYPYGLPASPDPLDGVEVFARRTLATSLALRTHTGAVPLLTEGQARSAGFPNARLGNLSLILAWALNLTKPAAVMPVLLEPDEIADEHVLRSGGDLPAMEDLLKSFNAGWSEHLSRGDRLSGAGQAADLTPGRRHVSLYYILQEMFGIDAKTVALPADDDEPQLNSGSARAACYLAWIGVETLDLAETMGKEMIMALRIKTDADAKLAEHPGALASNFALLLGAAIVHGIGVTPHFLPPDGSVAADLVAAAEAIAARNAGATLELEIEVVDLLELEDLAGRKYVHVGRVTRERVAQRLYHSVCAAGR